MGYEYVVEISFYDTGAKRTISYNTNANSLDELKRPFLKRFGNINSTPNKVMKEKTVSKETYIFSKKYI